MKGMTKLKKINIALRDYIVEKFGYNGVFAAYEVNDEVVYFDNAIIGITKNKKLVYDLRVVESVFKPYTSIRGNTLTSFIRGMARGWDHAYLLTEDDTPIDVKPFFNGKFVNKYKRWTDDEILFLSTNHDLLTIEQLMGCLCRSKCSITTMIGNMKERGIIDVPAKRRGRKPKAVVNIDERRMKQYRTHYKTPDRKPIETGILAVTNDGITLFSDKQEMSHAMTNGNIKVGSLVYEIEIKKKYVVKPGLSEV